MINKIIKAAVIGDPISHSLSPKLHNYWLQKYKINGSYEAIHVKKEDLESAIESMVKKDYAGFNVTIPHKEKVFQIIHELLQKSQGKISNSVKVSKAVNTVFINKSEKNNLEGYNSDDYGFAENLKNTLPNIILKDKNAFLIGAGGASRAIIFSLIIDFQVKNIFITNRSKDKFDQIYQDFATTPLLHTTNPNSAKLIFLEKNDFENQFSNCDILINATSLGMLNQAPLEINLEKLPKSAIVYDIVYKPLITDLLKNAKARGNKIVTGIGMLAFQAAIGFEKWFSHKPKIDNELLEFLTKESQK